VPHPFALCAKGWERCCQDQPFLVASVRNPAYDQPVAKPQKFDLENPATALDDEGEEILAEIDEGMRDAKAGPVVPAEKACELLPKWTTASSTRKKR